MTRAFSLPIVVTALLTVASAPAAAQTPGPGQLRAAPTFAGRATAPPPDRISLINVENHLTEVGGLYIQMNAVEIDEVLSPRLFTIRRPLAVRHEEDEPNPKVLLLLAAPLETLTRGTLVHVTGWVATPPSAAQAMGRDWGTSLDDEFFADANRPLILANIVRSPAGAELASRP
jgi:hypothetical protein